MFKRAYSQRQEPEIIILQDGTRPPSATQTNWPIKTHFRVKKSQIQGSLRVFKTQIKLIQGFSPGVPLSACFILVENKWN